MPLADFLKVLDEEVTPNVDPAKVLIIFSGGEVLVRKDLEEAGREVTKRGYMWGMVTNGMSLSRERLHSLVAAGLRSVSVSFDGFEDVHNYIRQNPDSFERARQAVANIREVEGLTYDVITCATPAIMDSSTSGRSSLSRRASRAGASSRYSPRGVLSATRRCT